MSPDETLVTFVAFVAGPFQWAFWLRQMRRLADRQRDLFAIALTLAASGLLLFHVLAHAAAADVVDSPQYIFMYLVLGFDWTKLTSIAADLAHVLYRWQQAGIAVHAVDLSSGRLVTNLSIAKPSGFRRAWYAAVALLGLRRSNVGGFGSQIPEQTASSGFYG